MSLRASIVAALLVGVSGQALAQTAPAESPPAAAKQRPLPHQIGLQFGLRTTNIPSSGF